MIIHDKLIKHSNEGIFCNNTIVIRLKIFNLLYKHTLIYFFNLIF